MPAGVSKLLTSSGASNLLGCGTYDLKGGAEIVNAAAPTGTKGLMNLGPPGSQFFRRFVRAAAAQRLHWARAGGNVRIAARCSSGGGVFKRTSTLGLLPRVFMT